MLLPDCTVGCCLRRRRLLLLADYCSSVHTRDPACIDTRRSSSSSGGLVIQKFSHPGSSPMQYVSGAGSEIQQDCESEKIGEARSMLA